MVLTASQGFQVIHRHRTAWLELGEAVRDALQVLPSLFKSDLVISGVRATDLHAFNTSLGATIEEQVVAGLNAIRDATWDKDRKYTDLRFVRQSQTFPDVVLKKAAPSHKPVTPIMGIELKGWYVMAKEGVPSFRYTTTPKAAAPQDLLVVFPWALSGVISGAPVLFAPYVTSARYAAEYRNWWWQSVGLARSTQAASLPSPCQLASDNSVCALTPCPATTHRCPSRSHVTTCAPSCVCAR